MRLHVLALAGDGIGPEVLRAAATVLEAVCRRFGHELDLAEGLIGGAAIARAGVPLPAATLSAAAAAGATLLGAVGLPEYDALPPERRPERGLLDLRKALGVFANLRPSRTWPSLLDASPLKNSVVQGTDLVFVRELTSGIYYGTPRGVSGSGPDERAVNTLSYSRAEIERVARVAFELALGRRRKVTSVDKSNVLENSQLWRRVVTAVARDYPDVELSHMLVDNCAMQIVLNPRQFDVVLTENMFGDILSDEAAVLAGSIGMLASASLGSARAGSDGLRQGLYEPVHGSAPDIAGRGVANPLGAIGSVAAMLDYSFGLRKEAAAVGHAIDAVVASGRMTADLRPAGSPATTQEVAAAAALLIGEMADA
ncbi:MAG: 3-isopropylmalate dehydrogenase [Acidobacteria bacterium]|nr:MAG: 3-isopropylmalate dehydrogenase [Acidobacteriota bacterium]